MNRTPEGTYFAGVQAFAYARRTCRMISTQVEKGDFSHAGLGIVLNGYDNELNKLLTVLESEIITSQIAKKSGIIPSLVNTAWQTAQQVQQPTINNARVYVALSVVENYVNEHTSTPEKTQTLVRRHKLLADSRKEHLTEFGLPAAPLETDLLRAGVIFLKSDVEKKLTPEELENANRALT